jgi:hypothetical protein
VAVASVVVVMAVVCVRGVRGCERAGGWAPIFPKFVLLLTQDAVTGLFATLLICALASTLAIRAALQVDPAEAIG